MLDRGRILHHYKVARAVAKGGPYIPELLLQLQPGGWQSAREWILLGQWLLENNLAIRWTSVFRSCLI